MAGAADGRYKGGNSLDGRKADRAESEDGDGNRTCSDTMMFFIVVELHRLWRMEDIHG